jgi:Xaa-Pro aminopeptidase
MFLAVSLKKICKEEDMAELASRERRLSRVRELMVRQDVDVLLITNFEKEKGAHNIRYLSGFTGSYGVCIVTQDRQILTTDSRYALQAPQEAQGWDVRVGGKAVEIVAGLGVKSVGVFGGDVSWDYASMLQEKLDGLHIVRLPNILTEVRAVKDPLEIESVRNAIRSIESVLGGLYGIVKVGRTTDCELATELRIRLLKKGHDISFAPIILSGSHSAFIHGDPFKLRGDLGYDKVIEVGDIIQFDIGARVDGYVSDISRVAVAGRATRKQKRMHEAIRRAIEESVQLYRPGMRGNLAQERANEILRSFEFPDIPHGLGHGIGMEVHEEPSTRGATVFQAGNVVSNEPGIYEEGYGGMRIERDVLITKHGQIYLDEFTTDLVEF